MTRPCTLCQQGQRLSTLTFAIFAVLLALAAMDPDETALRRGALALCAGLSGLAVFRFAVAASLTRALRLARRLQPRGQTRRNHGTAPQ
jgi:hypothetical protein